MKNSDGLHRCQRLSTHNLFDYTNPDSFEDRLYPAHNTATHESPDVPHSRGRECVRCRSESVQDHGIVGSCSQILFNIFFRYRAHMHIQLLQSNYENYSARHDHNDRHCHGCHRFPCQWWSKEHPIRNLRGYEAFQGGTWGPQDHCWFLRLTDLDPSPRKYVGLSLGSQHISS